MERNTNILKEGRINSGINTYRRKKAIVHFLASLEKVNFSSNSFELILKNIPGKKNYVGKIKGRILTFIALISMIIVKGFMYMKQK